MLGKEVIRELEPVLESVCVRCGVQYPLFTLPATADQLGFLPTDMPARQPCLPSYPKP